MSIVTRLFKKNKKIKQKLSKPLALSHGKAKKTKRIKKQISKKVTKKKIEKKPTEKERLIGIVTHYFPKVKAAVIKIKKDCIRLGDTLRIKGYTTDFIQKVGSIQIDLLPIKKATKGAEIGLKVKSRTRHNDLVYK